MWLQTTVCVERLLLSFDKTREYQPHVGVVGGGGDGPAASDFHPLKSWLGGGPNKTPTNEETQFNRFYSQKHWFYLRKTNF